MAIVGVAAREGRARNIRRALELIADQLDLNSRQRVLIKPNFVSTARPLCATHVDAVRAVLGVLADCGVREVTIAEGPSAESAHYAFERFGYTALQREFGVRLFDLNQDEGVPVQIYDRQLRPITIRIARTVVESDLRISVTPPKTHDTVIVTAGLKNVLMGSPLNPRAGAATGWRARLISGLVGVVPKPLRSFQNIDTYFPGLVARVYPSDKVRVHQGYPVANLNLFLLARVIRPHLTVLDATVAMEGAGPVDGDPVPMDLAIASTDAVAADALAAHLMGFDPASIGYLAYCGRAGLGEIDLARIQWRGVDPFPFRRRFRAHPTYAAQSQWQDARIDELVGRLIRPAAA